MKSSMTQEDIDEFNRSRILNGNDLDVLRQAISNLEELWEDWLDEVGDGSWDRNAVRQSITKAKKILNMDS